MFRDISYVCVYYLTRVDVSHFAIVAHKHTQTEEETPTTTNISERNNCFICHAPSFTFVFVYFCCCCGCCCRFFCVRFTLALSLSLSCQHRVLRILVFVSEQAINRQSEKHKPLLLIMIVVRNILYVYIFFAFVLSLICLSWLCHLCIWCQCNGTSLWYYIHMIVCALRINAYLPLSLVSLSKCLSLCLNIECVMFHIVFTAR